MKIAFITTMAGEPWGGSEELWAAAAKKALDEGHQVLVSVYAWETPRPKIAELVASGAILHERRLHSPIEEWPSLSQRMLNFVKRKINPPEPKLFLFQQLLDFKPEMICISQGDTYSAAFQNEIVRLVDYKIPYVLISQFNHEFSILSNSDIIEHVRKFCLGAQHFVFVSERNRQIACRQLYSMLPNALLISNPSNLNNKDMVPYPPTEKGYQLACVARLDVAFKGQDLLLEVLAQPSWRNRDWTLNLYGRGQSELFLKRLSDFLDMTNRVNFYGYVNDIRQVWANNHIQLMPSISEGTPLALQEAMLCGRTAVITDVGGNADLVGLNGERGFLANAPSIRSFSEAMEHAWLHRENWQTLGFNAHHYVSDRVDQNPETKLLQYLCGQKN